MEQSDAGDGSDGRDERDESEGETDSDWIQHVIYSVNKWERAREAFPS